MASVSRLWVRIAQGAGARLARCVRGTAGGRTTARHRTHLRTNPDRLGRARLAAAARRPGANGRADPRRAPPTLRAEPTAHTKPSPSRYPTARPPLTRISSCIARRFGAVTQETPVALSGATDDAAAQDAINAQGEINVVLRKAVYDDADRARILELLTQLGLSSGACRPRAGTPARSAPATRRCPIRRRTPSLPRRSRPRARSSPRSCAPRSSARSSS